MAGRKPPTSPGLWTLLLDKIGLSPAPKQIKKGKRRKNGPRGGTTRLDPGAVGDPALDAIIQAPLPGPAGPESPFAQYGQESGLGFSDALGYEAAAAAGYAPPMGSASATQEGANAPIPHFPTPAGGEPPSQPNLPFTPDRFAPPPASTRAAMPNNVIPFAPPSQPFPPADPGKLFNQDALDSSLDALFSGLESGLTAPPAAVVDDRPAFDEFGLTPPVPVAPVAPPTVEAAEDRPKPPPPIMPDPATMAPQAPPVTPPPAPMLAKAASDPLPMARREFGLLPPPARIALASGVDLKGLMGAIDRAPGVAGSMVVGYDGLIILTTLANESESEYLGAQATSLFAGAAVQLEKMKRGELQRLLLETDGGAMLMTAADMGILVVVSQDGQPMDVAAVLTTIAGSLGMG
jgi:predicted regulator of Ras-like GTPase activity (Roadblock/LC7/MglB family)